MSITWEDPTDPENGAKSVKWFNIFAELRQSPGNWALVHEGNAGMARQIRTGALGQAKPGEFETKLVSIPGTTPRRHKVYARYVGGDND